VFTRDVLDGKRVLVTFAELSQLSKEDWQRAREAIQASSRKEKASRSARTSQASRPVNRKSREAKNEFGDTDNEL
jgi:hypothetical protein